MYVRIPVGLLKKLLMEHNQQDEQYMLYALSYVQLLKNSLGSCAYHASRRRKWNQKWLGNTVYSQDIIANGASVQCNAMEGNSDPHTGRTVATAENLNIHLHYLLASFMAQSSPKFLHMACSLTDTSLLNFNIHKTVTRVTPQRRFLKTISEGSHYFETKWSIERNRMRICNYEEKGSFHTIKTFNSNQLGLLHFIRKAQGERALFFFK